MKNPWGVPFVRCDDCGFVTPPLQVLKDTKRSVQDDLPGRVLIVGAPKVCPKCHNLKKVPG